jgi:hypothetical protein
MGLQAHCILHIGEAVTVEFCNAHKVLSLLISLQPVSFIEIGAKKGVAQGKTGRTS